MQKILWTQVKNDTYGNPRSVCHFLAFLSEKEQEEERAKHGLQAVNYMFALALHRAKAIGGKAYRGNEYGGGIVFNAYNLEKIEQKIKELKGE